MSYEGDSPWGFLKLQHVRHLDHPEDDYLSRIKLIQTPWFGIFIHAIRTVDPRPTLHDHPWSFLSIILKGGYYERVFAEDGRIIPRRIKWFNWKPLGKTPSHKDAHTIFMLDRSPTWTLMFVGPKRRRWGYWENTQTRIVNDEHPYHLEVNRKLGFDT